MAELPKIDSEGLRLAKQVGAARVSSVVNVSKSEPRKYRLCDQTGEPCYRPVPRPKKLSDYRAAYLRASEAYSNINREVGEHLEALHDAMRRRDAYRPKYEKARIEVDRALSHDRVRKNLRKERPVLLKAA